MKVLLLLLLLVSWVLPLVTAMVQHWHCLSLLCDFDEHHHQPLPPLPRRHALAQRPPGVHPAPAQAPL